jgi:hypothetical protein
MHSGLQANLPFCRHDTIIGPAPHRFSTQKPHFLNEALLGSIGLLKVSRRVPNRGDDRRHSFAKLRVALKKRQKRFVTQLRPRHGWDSLSHRIFHHSPHNLESHPYVVVYTRSGRACHLITAWNAEYHEREIWYRLMR